MKKILVFLAMIFLGAGVVMPAVIGVEVSASGVIKEDVDTDCEKNFLGFVPWYKGLTTKKNNRCELGTPKGNKLPQYVLTIILNVLTDLFTAAGYLVTAFIIYGGYQYITSSGDPGKAAKAQKTITNAIVGLVLIVLANVIVNFIVKALTTQA